MLRVHSVLDDDQRRIFSKDAPADFQLARGNRDDIRAGVRHSAFKGAVSNGQWPSYTPRPTMRYEKNQFPLGISVGHPCGYACRRTRLT